MTKSLILAFFLSQALNGVAHADVYTKRVHTIHVYHFTNSPMVVAEDTFTTTHPPVPYWFFWSCNFQGQTAQQCIAIHSMLEQELKQ